MISGLTLIPNFISFDEEANLLELIDSFPWKLDLKRRVQHYGWIYNYRQANVSPTSSIPECFDFIINKLSQYFNANQLIINEYKPNQAISAHIDANCFGPVLSSISLIDECEMEFTKYNTKKKLVLPARSALILEGEARYNWTHALKYSGDKKRISLTFRTV